MSLGNDKNLKLGMQGCILVFFGIIIEQVIYQLFNQYIFDWSETTHSVHIILDLVGLVSLVGMPIVAYGFSELLRRHYSGGGIVFLIFLSLPYLVYMLAPLPFGLLFGYYMYTMHHGLMVFIFMALDVIMVYYLWGIRRQVASRRLLFTTMFALGTRVLVSELIIELLVFYYLISGGFWYYELPPFLPIPFGITTMIFIVSSYFLFRSELRRVKIPARAPRGVEIVG